MIIQNQFYTLQLNEKNGAIKSFKNTNGKEFICYTENRDLFTLTFFNQKTEKFFVSSNTAKSCDIKEIAEDTVEISYIGLGGYDINAQAYVRIEENSPFIYWSMKIQNNTALHLDKIDFPKVIVPNDLVATGGNGRIFTSMMEGLVVEDVEIRDHLKIAENCNDMATGWRGAYPGACPTQFSAYYSHEGGLYFAAHDNHCNPKIIEYYKQDGGVKLEFKLCPGTNNTKNFAYEYEMVLGVFEGDWYDAAEIYRTFIESSGLITLPKLKDNQNIPNWLKTSPIIVCYPVRGQVDSEFEEKDEWEYYPYTKATPYLKGLHEDLDSVIMPLLMHWEGTAPWAPPYVWPPYGDYSNFEQFITEMHEGGNLVGVYCSGISWSQWSTLIPAYNKEAEFEAEGWKDAVIVGPSQELQFTWKWIRYSYELCPSCQKTKDVAVKEFEKIVSNCDVDYVQFFDQNVGGASYHCYAKNHNHSFGAGKWMNEEMLKIADGMHEVLKKYNKNDKVLIGCEANAAEPFVNHFVFNDSRHNIDYGYGNPVPAYNYIFHEYVSNFMGNQNTSYPIVDIEKYPENVYYRFAHSFVQGDILTIVLKDQGKIHWDWCTPWEVPEIDQKEIKAFIREMNAWRKNIAKPSLQFGRMVKPFAYECGVYNEKIRYCGEHNYPSVESTCFEVEGGKKQQLFVNFLPYEQTIKVKVDGEVKIYEDAFGKNVRVVNEKEIALTLPARSVRMIEA